MAANAVRVVNVYPDKPDEQTGTISLVDGQLVFSNPDDEVLLRRWRLSNMTGPEIFADLRKGWSNGYVGIKP